MTNSDLKVAVRADAACASATARSLDSFRMVGAFPSIAIGANGNPIISY